LREKDFGAWRYVVGRSEKGLGAMIFLREYSAEGLHAFAEANRSLAEQLAATNETVPVEITFKAPVPLDQFRVWAKSKSILVEEAQLRQKAPYDTRGTLVVPGTKDDPLPEASVRKYTFGPISGVFYVRTTIPSQQLREFVTDPLVFLVDVSPIYVRKDLVEVGMAGAETARVMHYHGIFWEMENVGVAPSPTPYPAPVGTTEPTVSP
jgi:hypothetical protein